MHSAALHGPQVLRWKTAWLAIYIAACATLFLNPLRELFRLSTSTDTYSHILVIPFISICMIYVEREAILQRIGSTSRFAAPLFSIGILFYALSGKFGLPISADASLALAILGFLFLIWSGFYWVFGSRAFCAGLFPLLFLLLMVPLPESVIDRFIVWLQWGSGDVTSWIFHATGTPVGDAVRLRLALDPDGDREPLPPAPESDDSPSTVEPRPSWELCAPFGREFYRSAST